MISQNEQLQHSLRVLEYAQVFSRVCKLTRSSEGRNRLEQQGFSVSADELRQLQTESCAIQEVLLLDGYPMERYPEIHDALHDCRIEGTVLEPEQCAAVASYIESAGKEFGFVRSHIRSNVLPADWMMCEIPGQVCHTVWKYLDGTGRLMEERIPEIQNIVRRIHRASQDARNTAQGYIGNQQYKDYWTSDEPALRDGRLVLPLQENFRGRIPGIVHARSGSGNTLFFEPGEIMEANNRVSEAEAAYHRELHRILREMTAVIRSHRDAILQLQRHVGYLDDRCARGRYALRSDSIWVPVQPAMGNDRSIKLVQARHPLLGKTAVPISLEIDGDPQHFMILSGPNTGGKTVALKTLGLCAALHQHGLPVPAADGTVLPLFSAVCADIGDEQSIERSLSTFSGHMHRLEVILNAIDSNCLILLDELGTGTDPDEAGALAVAICEFLSRSSCQGVITTHLWALKELAIERSEFFNAAMAFDEDTHSPTYSITAGLPGSSYALDTAEAFGLPAEVIRRARELYESKQTQTTALIRRLAEKEARIEQSQRQAAEAEAELRNRELKLDEHERQLADREAQVRQGHIREMQHLLAESRSRVENLVKSIREQELTTERIQHARHELSEIESRMSEEQQRTDSLRSQSRPSGVPHSRCLSAGVAVRILSSGQTGVILRSDGKQKWKVAVGSLKLTVSEDAFTIIESNQKKAPKPVSVSAPAASSVYSLDVRGMRAFEAEETLQKSLDAALVAGNSQLAIIHGKGTGALQKALHALLKQHPAVESYGFSRPELGGSGRTEVVLRG